MCYWFDACACGRFIPTLMSTILGPETGVRDSTRQKRWRIHIWGWRVMGDMSTLCLGSMALSAQLLLWLFHLCSIRRRESGRAFPHCQLPGTRTQMINLELRLLLS